MDFPSWLPKEKQETWIDPDTGEIWEVTWKLAARSQQKVKPQKRNVETEAGYGKRRKQFLGNVAHAAEFLIPRDHAAAEKTIYKPIDDALYLMWQQHTRNSMAALKQPFDLDDFNSKWDGEYMKYLRYCPHSQMAIVSVYELARRRGREGGLTISNAMSLALIVQHIVQESWWLKDAWFTWKKLNPTEAVEVEARIQEYKEAG